MKIAIVKIISEYYYSDDDYNNIARTIVDWSEVDKETFNKLKKAFDWYNRNNSEFRYAILQQVAIEDDELVKTVENYINYLEQRRIKAEKAKLEREAKAEQKRLEMAKKNAKSRKALFEQLKKEFE